jgi:hypothetical protein
MKYTRLESQIQRHHVGSRSASHKKDKKRGDERRSIRYIAVDAEIHPVRQNYPGIYGIELMCDDQNSWSVCNHPDDLGAHLDREVKARSVFHDLTSRHGRPERVKRRDKCPLKNNTISFHPAVCTAIIAAINKGEDAELIVRRILAKFLISVGQLFAGIRHIIACAFHADTGTLHVDIVTSRQNHAGERIGKHGLDLAGPWTVGVWRQLECGANINPQKRLKYDAGMANFHRRHGVDAVPFDIRLAAACDKAAAAVLGDALRPHLIAYAASVPEREHVNALATLAELDAARQQVMASLRLADPGAQLYSDRTAIRKPIPQPVAPQPLVREYLDVPYQALF